MTIDERREAVAVIMAEANELLAGRQDLASDWLATVEGASRALHRLYEKSCNEPLTEQDEKRTAQLEREIRQRFERVGLGLYLNGDPRGNPVGILTPKTGRYNTMGGAECGWRL